jgi:hypothetical protein
VLVTDRLLLSLRGTRAVEDEVVREMLESGIMRPPEDCDNDRAPRAAG